MMNKNSLVLMGATAMALVWCMEAGAASAVASKTPWLEIAHRISEYSAKPSPSTAISAANTISKTPVSFSNSAEESKANDVIYTNETMLVLEQRVLMKERESVELAFRIKNIADGAFSEDIDVLLGQLIRIDPRLFLSELQRANVPLEGISGLVGNLGEDYVDEPEKQCAEIDLRKKALSSVVQMPLQNTKEQAIKALNERSSFCQDSKS